MWRLLPDIVLHFFHLAKRKFEKIRKNFRQIFRGITAACQNFAQKAAVQRPKHRSQTPRPADAPSRYPILRSPRQRPKLIQSQQTKHSAPMASWVSTGALRCRGRKRSTAGPSRMPARKQHRRRFQTRPGLNAAALAFARRRSAGRTGPPRRRWCRRPDSGI